MGGGTRDATSSSNYEGDFRQRGVCHAAGPSREARARTVISKLDIAELLGGTADVAGRKTLRPLLRDAEKAGRTKPSRNVLMDDR
jgi:hypothetical protein